MDQYAIHARMNHPRRMNFCLFLEQNAQRKLILQFEMRRENQCRYELQFS